MQNDSGATLRSLINRKQGVFAYGVEDAMSARVATHAGVECVYAGGYSAAGSKCLPDMGILTLTEVVNHMRFVSDAVAESRIPVVADIDDGYGGVLNVRRAVSEILSLPWIAAVHLEDQKLPKRCGHIAGKEVVPVEEFLPKLKMALKTRDEFAPRKLIIARTDAFSAAGGKKDGMFGGDMAESVRRGQAYSDAGADVVWCEFPTPSLKTAQEFARAMHEGTALPLGFNISPSFYDDAWDKSDIRDEKMLQDLGYKFRFATYPALQAKMLAVLKSATEFGIDAIDGMRRHKSCVRGTLVEPVNVVIGVADYQALERAVDPSAAKKQKDSEGYK